MERLTQNSFYTSARALFERDRSLFAVLCALEVKQVRGNNFIDTSRGSNVEDIAWSRADTKRTSEIFFFKKKTLKSETNIFLL